MRRRLEKIAGDQGMRKEARRAASDVWSKRVPIMQARTPVKTGRLQRSEKFRVMVSSKKEDIRLALIAGGDGVLYARKVHDTHKTHSGFMLSVLMEAATTVAREIGAELHLENVVPPAPPPRALS